MSGKDPITCHVLDTTAGKPAANIHVTLIAPSSVTFESTTDADGRIKLWLPAMPSSGQAPSVSSVLKDIKGASRWTLKFDTETYYGEGKTFFPEATIVFRVEEGQSYHVPLLLSPFSYTTYRGS